jgi:molybdenum cofactor biosynthesis enzyme MoaA
MSLLEWNFAKAPKYLQIETTIVCQAVCSFCPQKKATRRPLFMDEKVIDKIIEETQGHSIVYRPFILNEPFADKRMPAIVKKIKKDKTATVEFNTNGELVSEKMGAELLEAGVDVMRFSVDGIRKETFNEARGINFDRTYKNVKAFIERAIKENHPVDLEVRMIKLPNTEEEQIEFKKFWESTGARVLFTDLYSYPWELQNRTVHKPCLKVLDQMFVYVDGQVTLCCWDSAERAVVGDTKLENTLDIWNGPILGRYRELLAHGQRDKILLCSRCDAYENFDFSKISTSTKSQQQNLSQIESPPPSA